MSNRQTILCVGGMLLYVSLSFVEAFDDPNPFPNWFGVYQNDPQMSKAEMEGYFQTFKNYGVNHYLPFAGSDGHTNYPSTIVKHCETIDYMQQAIDLGKTYQVKIHLWHPIFMIKGASGLPLLDQLAEEGRLCVDKDGTIGDMQHLNPADSRNRTLDLSVIEELVRRYPDAASLNLDYVRYPNSDYDFGPITRQAFETKRGSPVSQWPAQVLRGGSLETEFIQFRKNIITEHVRAIRALVRSCNPDMLVTAAVFPDSTDPDILGQDWPRWAQEGLVDVMMPMVYTIYSGNVETGTGTWYARCVKWELAQTRGTPALQSTGIGTSNNDGDINPVSNMISQTFSAFRAGANSFYVFANDDHFRDDFLPAYISQISGVPFIQLDSPNGKEILKIGSSYKITWTNFNQAQSLVPQVKIMLSSDGGTTYSDVVVDSTPNIGSFSWTVPSDSNALYRLRIYDAHNSSIYDFSDEFFTVASDPDTIPPVLSNVEVSDIGSSTATITWNTNEPAISWIEYGLTASHGQRTAFSKKHIKSQVLSLTGLEPEKQYHYRAISRDISGNEAQSDDASFTMKKASAIKAPKNYLGSPGQRGVYVLSKPAAVKKGSVIRIQMGIMQSIKIKIYDATGRFVHSVKMAGEPQYTENREPYYEYKWTEAKNGGVYFATVYCKKADGTTAKTQLRFTAVRNIKRDDSLKTLHLP